MKDRFKFKHWDKQIKQMRYGDIQLGYNGQPFVITDNKEKPVEDIKDVVTLQCTGLKDKNGKLIYEGDILKTANGVGIVSYFESTASYKLATLMPSGDYGFTRLSIHITDTWYYLEDWNLEEQYVIGNKFENPELLKNNKLDKSKVREILKDD